jgi:hypothetical protein
METRMWRWGSGKMTKGRGWNEAPVTLCAVEGDMWVLLDSCEGFLMCTVIDGCGFRAIDWKVEDDVEKKYSADGV